MKIALKNEQFSLYGVGWIRRGRGAKTERMWSLSEETLFVHSVEEESPLFSYSTGCCRCEGTFPTEVIVDVPGQNGNRVSVICCGLCFFLFSEVVYLLSFEVTAVFFSDAH